MEETKNLSSLLHSDFYNKIIALEENSEKELDELKNLKDSLFDISGINSNFIFE